MGISVTNRTDDASKKIVKTPNLVLKIDGVDDAFGSINILKLVQIGDEGLEIGDDWVIGGVTPLEDQQTLINMSESTTTINQQLDVDKGRGSSISSMEIALIDFNQTVTRLITPGEIVEDLLGRKARVYLGFSETSFPVDYITIFRGIVDDIKSGAGEIKLNIAHPDQKKRQTIFQKTEHELDGPIDDTTTTINLDTVSGLLVPITGPDGTEDTSYTGYIKIDDEIIKYTGVSGSGLTGVVRGEFNTIAAAHDDESAVSSFYRLEGNAIDLALKLMLSGWNGHFISLVEITHFNKIQDGDSLENAVYFHGVNLESEYGITIGDYFKSTGASNGANNAGTWSEIIDVFVDETGSYIVVDDVTFVEEIDSVATCSFRSRYDTLPSGCKMSPDEVDVAEHTNIQRLYLSSFDYDFYLKDTIGNCKEFIEEEIYKPSGAYSLPRKARSSVGYFIGPLPSADTITLDDTNVVNPKEIKLRRTINKNFFNNIVYKYEVDPLEDKFLRGFVLQSATSLSRIPVGNRALVIPATGMRDILDAQNIANISANRRLNRFKFGAEFFEGIGLRFQEGYKIEIGDLVIFDGRNLEVSDTITGVRGKEPRFFEIVNKKTNIATGKVILDLLDTQYDGSQRYGLIAPSSKVKVGISNTKFVIEEYYRSPFGSAEYKKWDRYPNCRIKVRSSDFTTRYFQTFITDISGNTITVNDDMGFTPQPGDVMEMSKHNFPGVSEIVKLKYVHLATLTDGSDPYVML